MFIVILPFRACINKFSGLLVILIFIFFPGCASTHKIEHLSGWIVYWDRDKGIKELEKHIHIYDQINVFAVDFRQDSALTFPPGFTELLNGVTELAGKNNTDVYVSIVNDIRAEGIEKSSLKDPGVIHLILSSPDRMEKHINQLTDIARDNRVHGIDIDYENLNAEDLNAFSLFVGRLSVSLRKIGKGLDITLEPGNFTANKNASKYISDITAAASKVNIMGYNLHYPPHTKPGPRSTPDWLSAISHSAVRISSDYPWSMALATHGFEWDDAEGRSVAPEETGGIIKKLRIRPERDPRHHVPNFSYFDLNGSRRTVWYEDAISFKEKWRDISGNGITRLSVWRIGGNGDELYSFINEYKAARQIHKPN